MNYTAGSYVRKFFRMYFLACYNEIDNKEVNVVVYQIGDSFAKKYGVKQILAGKVDDILYKTIEKYIKNKKTKLWEKHVNLKNYITKYICSNVNVTYSKDTLNYFVDRVSNKLMTSFSYNDLMEGKVDKIILTTYYEIADKLCQKIYNYVRGYIINNAIPINDVDEVKISKAIVEEVMTTNKYNATDLLLGRCNDMIKKRVAKYQTNIEKGKQDSVDYIYMYILKNFDDGLEFDEIREYALYIDNYLRTNKGLISKDITSHKYDADIVRLYNRKKMKDNSVQIEEERRMIKHEKRKRKIQKNVVSLLIVATLVGVLGTAGDSIGKAVDDGIDDLSSQVRYNQASSTMNGSKYDSVFTKYSDSYVLNMDQIVRDYDNYSKLGEIYGYLGFYEAYKHTNSDSFAIMDSMLEDIGYKIFDDKYDTNLNVDTDYFIEFIYNRLVEMECEEVQQEKYINAIDEYKRASWANKDENKTTMDYIHENNRKLEKVIFELSDMYDEYSSKYYKQLSEIYGDTQVNRRKI